MTRENSFVSLIAEKSPYESICSILGDNIVSRSTYEFRLRRFEDGDRKHSGASMKIKTDELQALLDADRD